MTPRLKNSKAWTALPHDFTTQVLAILNNHFQNQASVGKFLLDGRIYKQEILLRMGYIENGKIRPLQFDLSTDYDSQKSEPIQYFERLVDLGASLLDNLFQNPDEEFPLDWHAIEFEGAECFIKQETTNPELEKLANELLGDVNDEDLELIHGDLENDDIETIANSLNTTKNPKN